jgi:hypothetical protein
METGLDCENMGLLGRWRIFTHKEEGSLSIQEGSSTGRIASANRRRNWSDSGKSSTSRGGGDVLVEPVGASSVDRCAVKRSCRRTIASRPDMSVNIGERSLIRCLETGGIEAARRKWIFCCFSVVSRGVGSDAVGGVGPGERSSRCCEVSWYMRPVATHEVGMSMHNS